MTKLSEIAAKLYCDKGPHGPAGFNTGHNYTEIYPEYLPKDPKKILEIGVRTGASIKMWEEYWPNIESIYGLDFCIECTTSFLKDLQQVCKKFKPFYADQSNREHLKTIVETIGAETLDFIIDDGSHMTDHQQISLACLFPLLKSGGLYIIEDLTDKVYPQGGWNIKDMVNYTDATINILDNFIKTKKFITPYLNSNETNYLENAIDKVELNLRLNHNCAFIIKK